VAARSRSARDRGIRAGCATPEEKRARVLLIADMMARNEYRTRLTASDLARTWGVAYETVVGYACEASRLFLIPPEQLDAKRAQLAATFEALAWQAANDRDEKTGLAAPYDAARILLEYAKLVGIEVDKPALMTGENRPRIEIKVIADGPSEAT
jgi:hypothetical protein